MKHKLRKGADGQADGANPEHVMSAAHDNIAPCFQGLIYRVFQEGQGANSERGIAIAFVSAHPGAGTTFLTNSLTETLDRGAPGSTALLDCRRIVHGREGALHIPSRSSHHTGHAQSGLVLQRGDWRANRDLRNQWLQVLRSRFSYVLLDCPSLRESKDVLGLTTLVDGVVLVVEANKTSKSQLAHLERVVRDAGGKILGSMLNKRTYPIPAWIW